MPFVEPAGDDAAHRPANRVMTLREWAERCGFSEITGWRLLRNGNGPKVTQLSTRRIGIREDHHAQWLDSRVRCEIEK
jgi:predicted DNA-binding transcriptional regulator AlpA